MKLRFFSAFETAMVTFYSDLIPFLASIGSEVEVVISKAEYRGGRDLEKALSQFKGATIFRTANFGRQPSGKINKTFVMLAYLIHMAIHTLFGPGVNRNVFLTTPPLLPVWGYILSKIRRQPYYCVTMDIFPQLLIEYGMMRREAPLTRLSDWLSTMALREAEGVIVIGRCMRRWIEAKGVSPERIHIIPNWMNEELVKPIQHEDNPFRQEHGLADKFVVLYSGNMGYSHYFDDILTVAEQMKGHEKVVFVFIGDGSRYKEIKEGVESRQLTNVMLLPFQDVSMLSYSLSAGDLHLVTLRDSCTGLAVPSKSYGIFAAGRPILYQGSEEGEIARVILEEDIGAVVPCGDVEGLKQAILRYASQPELSQSQGRKARALMEGPLSRARSLERYGQTLTHAHVKSSSPAYSPQN